MKKDVKLYNLIFPSYLIMFLAPGAAIYTLLGNFIVDSIVLYFISKAIYKSFIGKFYLKTIWKVWLLGFLSDIIGVIYLLFSADIFFPTYHLHLNDTSFTGEFARGVSGAVSGSAFVNFWSFLIRFSAVILAGFFIFVFNYYVSFSKAEMTKSQKLKSALAYAIITAPYTILIY